MRKADVDSSTVQMSLRVTRELLKRADKIATILSPPGKKLTRADAIRAAIDIAFDQLEKRK